jgi:hypothetical protein
MLFHAVTLSQLSQSMHLFPWTLTLRGIVVIPHHIIPFSSPYGTFQKEMRFPIVKYLCSSSTYWVVELTLSMFVLV